MKICVQLYKHIPHTPYRTAFLFLVPSGTLTGQWQIFHIGLPMTSRYLSLWAFHIIPLLGAYPMINSDWGWWKIRDIPHHSTRCRHTKTFSSQESTPQVIHMIGLWLDYVNVENTMGECGNSPFSIESPQRKWSFLQEIHQSRWFSSHGAGCQRVSPVITSPHQC